MAPSIGLVEIRQDSKLAGGDIYIVALQATQVYYLSYPFQTGGWDIVHKVSPHGKLPIPNDADYNLDPNANEREFFQEDGLEGSFEIDLTDLMGMEVDNEKVDDDARDEVENVRDLEFLRLGRDNEEDIPPSDTAGAVDMADSDDEDYDPANLDLDDYF